MGRQSPWFNVAGMNTRCQRTDRLNERSQALMLPLHIAADGVRNGVLGRTPHARRVFEHAPRYRESQRGDGKKSCATQPFRKRAPPRYAWANPAYDIAHASIVDCHRNLLGALQGRCAAETTGQDNLKTMELVFAAYESAARDKVILV